MRYMIFGDVHGNLLALEAVLAAAQQRGATGYLFVGDLVGYGPQPLECLERLLALQQAGQLAWVVGNHELVIRDECGTDGYSEEARQTLAWTQQLIARTKWAKKFIAAGHLTLQVDDGIWLAHDSLAFPNNGRYHREPRQCRSEIACLRYLKGRVCFYGHTHVMRAELMRQDSIWMVPTNAGPPDVADPKPLTLAAGDLGWIGTGSTGLPTNPDRLAEFLILDDADAANWRVEKYAVAYSREVARERTERILSAVCTLPVAQRIARWL